MSHTGSKGRKSTLSLVGRVASLALLAACFVHSLPAAAQESSEGMRRVVEKIEPSYPPLARRNGLSGTVKLRVIIGTDGKPKKVEVLGGNPVFVENASDSVKKWKWASADRETTEVVQVNFTPGN